MRNGKISAIETYIQTFFGDFLSIYSSTCLFISFSRISGIDFNFEKSTLLTISWPNVFNKLAVITINTVVRTANIGINSVSSINF